MDRLKTFGIWLILIIAFAIFSNVIIYGYLHAEEVGGTIYNMTHKEQVINEAKK